MWAPPKKSTSPTGQMWGGPVAHPREPHGCQINWQSEPLFLYKLSLLAKFVQKIGLTLPINFAAIFWRALATWRPCHRNTKPQMASFDLRNGDQSSKLGRRDGANTRKIAAGLGAIRGSDFHRSPPSTCGPPPSKRRPLRSKCEGALWRILESRMAAKLILESRMAAAFSRAA